MSSATMQLETTARYIEQIEQENADLKKQNEKLIQTNAKLYENVDRFVSRKTVNDFPIGLNPKEPDQYFDFRFEKRNQQPSTRIQ